MLAVVVPAHNEEAHLADCLQSLSVAARCDDLKGEPVALIVVLDACSDASRSIALAFGAHIIDTEVRNVGKARALGAELALSLGARWLSFTDADTQVDARWLALQIALRADAVCGTVGIRDWGDYGQAVQRRYLASYKDADGHRHIHGANLGLSAGAYRKTGGFRSLASSEDVALVRELLRHGLRIAWSAAPRVYTSVRKAFRAPDGFGAYLMRLEAERAA